ncbi:MAG: glycosyltransferase [Hamadaea sp.]|nr:glycosyltransferase [Hamadaea sp.]
MNPPELVSVPARPIGPLAAIIGPQRTNALTQAVRNAPPATIWQVNSTASGGGVAEMLHSLLGYLVDLGIDVRWLVLDGEEEFFDLTKRLHNRLHGAAAGPELCDADADLYREVSMGNARELIAVVRPGDTVVLHDPQTAGVAPALAEHGATVVWRCHIGNDTPSPVSEAAWRFLGPHISRARAHVFSRKAYAPGFLPGGTCHVIAPSIDPFTPKNIDLDTITIVAILRTVGILEGPPALRPTFTRRDGSTGHVIRTAHVVAEELPAAGDPVLLQVSRWDRLKDMTGVMTAFADHVARSGPGCLILAGPAVDDVSDDPEGAQVYTECHTAWQQLAPDVRRRVMLVTLPMDDLDENAVVVNALQRYARVVAQKSLAEGFGLTVAEAMWKRTPVVGSRVGGITDQIVGGTGYLVEPGDLASFGKLVRLLFEDHNLNREVGQTAQQHVLDTYLADTQLRRWAVLLADLGGRRSGNRS